MLYVVFIVVLYRIGAVIPVPYISADAMNYIMSYGDGSIFQYMSILSGTAFSRATLFALSISPYINASIIMQLLTTAIPALENLAKEEDGRKKITQITRYVTVALGLITAYGYYMYIRNIGVLLDNGVFAAIVIIACYTAGSSLIMWLARKSMRTVSATVFRLFSFQHRFFGSYDHSVAYLLYHKRHGRRCHHRDSQRSYRSFHGCIYRIYHEFRKTPPDSVREACGRQKDVWRSELDTSAQAQYDRRHADNLRKLDPRSSEHNSNAVPDA